MNYIVYNSNGDILRIGNCKEIDLPNQARQGEYVLEGVANPVTQKVINGEVVDKSQDEINKVLKKAFEYDLRAKRNSLLKETDWTQMPDSPLTDLQREKYKVYRQALRDLPQKYGTINKLSEVTFPSKPE